MHTEAGYRVEHEGLQKQFEQRWVGVSQDWIHGEDNIDSLRSNDASVTRKLTKALRRKHKLTLMSPLEEISLRKMRGSSVPTVISIVANACLVESSTIEA